MSYRVDHIRDREWWKAVALHLRSCPKLKEDLSQDAVKANIALKLEYLAKFCDHESGHCNEQLNNSKEVENAAQ